MSSTKQQARVAGLLYLLLALSAPIGLIYVPGKVAELPIVFWLLIWGAKRRPTDAPAS
jgi:hypothetical protein